MSDEQLDRHYNRATRVSATLLSVSWTLRIVAGIAICLWIATCYYTWGGTIAVLAGIAAMPTAILIESLALMLMWMSAHIQLTADIHSLQRQQLGEMVYARLTCESSQKTHESQHKLLVEQAQYLSEIAQR